jgi:hypothetical protein
LESTIKPLRFLKRVILSISHLHDCIAEEKMFVLLISYF